MKYTKWKTSLTILAILAAGTCYSCSADEKWQEIAPSSQREETEQEFSVSGSDAESSLRDNSSALADAGESKEMKGSDAMETAAEQTEESAAKGENRSVTYMCAERWPIRESMRWRRGAGFFRRWKRPAALRNWLLSSI